MPSSGDQGSGTSVTYTSRFLACFQYDSLDRTITKGRVLTDTAVKSGGFQRRSKSRHSAEERRLRDVK